MKLSVQRAVDRSKNSADPTGIELLLQKSWVQRLVNNRFIKFGSVGLSGTVVNLIVLYLGQEYIFRGIPSAGWRLNVSLACAIVCATINNFAWNRLWTWADRKAEIDKHFALQLGQYFIACWVAIALQFIITKILAVYVYYLAANVTAIVLSSIINFFVNDAWTFSMSRGR